MQNRFEDAILTQCRIRNVHFLLQEQVQLLDRLADAGGDTANALDLLRKLMDIESVMQTGPQAAWTTPEAPFVTS